MAAADDFASGRTVTLGAHTFTADEILRFAHAWDPQPFHLDEVAAAKTHFGGLVASGWHTAAVMMRLTVDHFGKGPAPRFAVSPGFESMKWLKPVRPGDTVTYTATRLSARPSRSRPGTEVVRTLTEGRNQHGELVFSIVATVLAADG